MNNELYMWMVKGRITENKGNDVNWAKATTTIAREKARRVSSGSLLKLLGEKLDWSASFKQPSSLSTCIQLSVPTLKLDPSKLGEFDLIKRPTTL
jgi:hypothetical protein